MWVNASIFEKLLISGMVTTTAAFIGYNIFKTPSVKKEDAFKIRQDLIKQKNVKMLYSTMSFFVLQGFKSKDPESFFTLQDILNIERPQIVAIPISKDEYEEKYEKALHHPRFKDAIERFRHAVKNKKTNEILEVKDFNLKNLEILYLIDHCISLKNCKVVYARKAKEIYKKMDQNYKKMTKKDQENATDGNKAKIQDFTDILVAQMKPTLKFALSPQSPFKQIVGIIEPELVSGVARRWKEKFKQHYSHTVMEDEEVLMKQQEQQRKEQEMQSKFNVQNKQI